MRLSPDELRDALFKECKIKMIDDEVKVIKDYFFNKFKSNQISKNDFEKLLNHKFEKKSDAVDARKALYEIRNKL